MYNDILGKPIKKNCFNCDKGYLYNNKAIVIYCWEYRKYVYPENKKNCNKWTERKKIK